MEKVYNYDDWKLYRFTCDCRDPGCCIDLNITTEEDVDNPMVLVSIHQSYSTSLWERIKRAYKYIFKGEAYCLGEVVLQEKDKEDLVRILLNSTEKKDS